jgi:hypothetical protein
MVNCQASPGMMSAMKTSSFFAYKGPGRVSIARFPPRNTPAGFRVYKKLAPGPWFNSVSRDEYDRLYGAQLAALDPAVVKSELQALAGDAEPVLLCWERTPFTEKNWCHRRIVARWLHETLGEPVPERIEREQLEQAVFDHLNVLAAAEREDFTRTCDGRPLGEFSESELVEMLPRGVALGLGLR